MLSYPVSFKSQNKSFDQHPLYVYQYDRVGNSNPNYELEPQFDISSLCIY